MEDADTRHLQTAINPVCPNQRALAYSSAVSLRRCPACDLVFEAKSDGDVCRQCGKPTTPLGGKRDARGAVSERRATTKIPVTPPPRKDRLR
jgi:hypothetical protein